MKKFPDDRFEHYSVIILVIFHRFLYSTSIFPHNFSSSVCFSSFHSGRDVYGLRQDGSTIPVHVYVCSGEAGGEKFYAAFLRNLSEQKEKEKEFTTKSDEFRSILSSCNDVAFLATNSRGEILLSNTAGLYNVLGWQSSELVTRSKSNRLQSVGDDSFGSLNRSTGIQPSGSSSGFVSSSQVSFLSCFFVWVGVWIRLKLIIRFVR